MDAGDKNIVETMSRVAKQIASKLDANEVILKKLIKDGRVLKASREMEPETAKIFSATSSIGRYRQCLFDAMKDKERSMILLRTVAGHKSLAV